MKRKREDDIVHKLQRISIPLILLVTLTACIGFATLYSAASSFDPWASLQMLRFSFFFFVMLLVAVVDIRFWIRHAYFLYAVALVFLIAAELAGHTAMGATRWVRIGPFTVQPSEPMKILLIFALARYFHALPTEEVHRNVLLIPPLILTIVPVGLILAQPDLGTAIVLLAASGCIFFVAGVKLWKFVVVFLLGIASIPLAWRFGLHDYQKKRVLTFLDPESDPLGAGYNILQSKIAVGSGGFWGKGFLQGTQSQLSFLPEKQTDFIFTMFAEEWGFVGGCVLIFLYLCLIVYGYRIALSCRNHFGRLLGVGITSVFFLHIFVNIAMVTGMMPVVGEPLPLLSYGGTMMATMLIAFGLLLNIHIHRDFSIDRLIPRMKP